MHLFVLFFTASALFALTPYEQGRGYFAQGDYKKAANSFQEAVASEPENSDRYLWLGRAFGRRAEHASPFAAPAYAVKSRRRSLLAVPAR